jgi:hypothetical protein
MQPRLHTMLGNIYTLNCTRPRLEGPISLGSCPRVSGVYDDIAPSLQNTKDKIKHVYIHSTSVQRVGRRRGVPVRNPAKQCSKEYLLMLQPSTIQQEQLPGMPLRVHAYHNEEHITTRLWIKAEEKSMAPCDLISYSTSDGSKY